MDVYVSIFMFISFFFFFPFVIVANVFQEKRCSTLTLGKKISFFANHVIEVENRGRYHLNISLGLIKIF